MKQSELIVKNLLAGAVAVGVGGLLQTVAIILVARYVSVSLFGTYSFILAFAMFFQFVADSGVSNILMRDLAVSPDKMAETLGGALWLSWLLSIGVGLVMWGIIPFLHFSLEVKLLAAIMGINCLSNFPCGCYGAVLRSQEDNESPCRGVLTTQGPFPSADLFFAASRHGLDRDCSCPPDPQPHSMVVLPLDRAQVLRPPTDGLESPPLEILVHDFAPGWWRDHGANARPAGGCDYSGLAD